MCGPVGSAVRYCSIERRSGSIPQPLLLAQGHGSVCHVDERSAKSGRVAHCRLNPLPAPDLNFEQLPAAERSALICPQGGHESKINSLPPSLDANPPSSDTLCLGSLMETTSSRSDASRSSRSVSHSAWPRLAVSPPISMSTRALPCREGQEHRVGRGSDARARRDLQVVDARPADIWTKDRCVFRGALR
jgi:hypothetical protein